MKIDETLLAELNKGYHPGTSHWVKVTHINNPLSFYVRPTKYDSILETLESQVPVSKDTNLTDWIMYNRPGSKGYSRGQVLFSYQKASETVCDILTIDYGFLEKGIPTQLVWKCDDSIRFIPPLAVHCQLANCAPLGDGDWSMESIEAMKFYCGNERAKMIIVGYIADKLNVTLINSCPDDIATMLALTQFSTLGYSHNMLSRVPTLTTKHYYYKFKDLKVNDTLHVRMQIASSLNEFYVAEVNDYYNYVKNKDFMSIMVMKQKGLSQDELVENMPVCVLNDLRKYERAVLKNFNSSKIVVQLVDSGKICTEHISNIKRVPDAWLENAVIAIYCSAEESQLHDIRFKRIFQPGYEFLITIKQLGNQFVSPHIVSIKMIEQR